MQARKQSDLSLCSLPFLSISFLWSHGSRSLWLLPLCVQALVENFPHLILLSHLPFFCLPPWPSSFFSFYAPSQADHNLNNFKYTEDLQTFISSSASVLNSRTAGLCNCQLNLKPWVPLLCLTSHESTPEFVTFPCILHHSLYSLS